MAEREAGRCLARVVWRPRSRAAVSGPPLRLPGPAAAPSRGGSSRAGPIAAPPAPVPVSDSPRGGRAGGERGSADRLHGGVCGCLRCSAPCCLLTGARRLLREGVCEPSPGRGPSSLPLAAPLRPWRRPPAASSAPTGRCLWRPTAPPRTAGTGGFSAPTRDRPAFPRSQGPRSTQRGCSLHSLVLLCPAAPPSFQCARK